MIWPLTTGAGAVGRGLVEAPNGKTGAEAFVVIRDAMQDEERVALARIVMAHREHMTMLEPLGKGLLGTTLRFEYEVRSEKEYFSHIPSPRISAPRFPVREKPRVSHRGAFSFTRIYPLKPAVYAWPRRRGRDQVAATRSRRKRNRLPRHRRAALIIITAVTVSIRESRIAVLLKAARGPRPRRAHHAMACRFF
jgi:hypothetical protein